MFTPLTEEQYNKALKAGFTHDQIVSNEQRRKMEESDTAEQPQTQTQQQPGFFQSIAQGITQPFLQGLRLPLGLAEQGIGKLTGDKGMAQQGADLGGNKQFDFGYLGKVNAPGYDEQGNPLGFGRSLGQAAGAGAQIAPWFVGAGEAEALSQGATRATLGGLVKSGIKTGASLGGVAGAGTAIQEGAEQGQDLATTGVNALIQGGVGTVSGGLLGGALAGGGGLLGKVRGITSRDVPTIEAIKSVDPDLSGKALANAYETAAREGRYSGGSAPGINPRVEKIGSDLADFGLKSNDPRGNLVKLDRAMQSTEARIKPFEDFPVSNGVKRTLVNELETLKTRTPREFGRIKESKGTFDDVVDFAKELVGNSKDTIGGYRRARTVFDQQAKLEFPTAYKNGAIDTKTPAGNAIKLVRDLLNDNLYQIAPTNSNLQNLITREANIYQAMHNVAPKVAKLHGLSGMNLFLKTHPTTNAILSVARKGLPYAAGSEIGNIISHLIP